MSTLELWELMSYMVTVIGLPLAIFVFLFEQRKERENEEEVYQLLSDNYQDFLKVALDHSDLRLFSNEMSDTLSDEQQERLLIIFTMLTSLFERAYLLLYEDKMSPKQARRWNSWEDYIMEWCNSPHFVQACLNYYRVRTQALYIILKKSLPQAFNRSHSAQQNIHLRGVVTREN